MCGIVGYIGKDIKCKKVVKILQKLEYRGYDSAGVSYYLGNNFTAIKSVGKIEKLRKKIDKSQTSINIIAHTRWATHGVPNEQNAHPHQSKNKIWTIVHNGIIENYINLKNNLKFLPISQTDTEIVAQLLEEKNIQNISEFIEFFNEVEGSFAILAQNVKKSNELFVAKRNSPLYACKTKDGVYLASDPICFAGLAKEYFAFKDNEFAEVFAEKIYFFNNYGNKINKKPLKLDLMEENITKQDHKYFMEKEIFEQSDILIKQVESYKNKSVLQGFNKDFISQFNKVELIGCGTAYHVALVGAKLFEEMLYMPASADIASEFIYNKARMINPKTLYIFISQSGETADTIRAKTLVDGTATYIVLTNVLYSTLTQNAKYILPTYAGREISVAATKSYVCQLSALYMLVSNFKNEIKNTNWDFYAEVQKCAKTLLNFSFNTLDIFAEKLSHSKDAVFIGKDLDFVTAREGALKLKEISYINSNASPAGELKHGYLAIIEKGMPIIVIATNRELNNKTFSSAIEAEARGAEKFIITNDNLSGDNILKINCENKFLMPIASIVPLQYLAFKVSILKNLNPDMPRNLAKSVTVE